MTNKKEPEVYPNYKYMKNMYPLIGEYIIVFSDIQCTLETWSDDRKLYKFTSGSDKPPD